MLYLNVGGLTNMAIAEGTLCRFTRVVGGGLEAMASEIAERKGIPLVDARAQLAEFVLPRPGTAPEPAQPGPAVAAVAARAAGPGAARPRGRRDVGARAGPRRGAAAGDAGAGPRERADDPPGSARAAAGTARSRPAPALAVDPEVRMVLENGIREIVGEVRNSLDFHRSQEGGGEVRSVVLSGPALDMRGFSEALEADLGLQVRRESVRFAENADQDAAHRISPHRLAIATGLATEEAPR